MISLPAHAAFAVLVGSLALPPAGAGSAPPAAADLYGDPLPPGAVARLGTLRLRQTCAALAWAPDGKTFASAAADGAIRIWDAATGKEVRQLAVRWNSFNAIVYDPDGKHLFAGDGNGAVHVLDAATGRELRAFRPEPEQTLSSRTQLITALVLRPDQEEMLTLGYDNTLRVWDMTTGAISRQLVDGRNGSPFVRMALSADGRRYATWAKDDLLTVWGCDGKELFHAPTQLKPVEGLVFSADGKTLAVYSTAAAQIALWDLDAGKELPRLEGVCVVWGTLAFSLNGKYLAGKGADGLVHLWVVASGKDLRQFKLPQGMLISTRAVTGPPLAFSPDGKALAAAHGVAIHLWDVEANKELLPFADHNAPIDDLHFSADGKRVLTCGKDGEAGQWDSATGKLLNWRTRSEGGVLTAAVAAADGKTVLFARKTDVVRWNVESDGAAERPLVAGLPVAVNVLALSADGKTLAGFDADLTTHLWDVESGKEKGKLKNELRNNPAQVLSADGGTLAIGGAPLRLWEAAAGREARPFDDGVAAPAGQRLAAWPLVFAPDGRTLASTSGVDLTFWEVATGRDRMRLALPDALFIHRAAFSPDGCVVAVGTHTGSVHLLDATDGWELARLTGHGGAVTGLAFAPDGRTLASAGAEGTALVWDVKEWIGRKRPAAELSDEKLSAKWKDLLDGDDSRAYKAILALAASPKAAAPYLKERLTAAEGPEERWIAQLIKDLNDDEFDGREKAQKELEKLGEPAIPALRKALQSNPSAESRRRVQELLDKHKGPMAVTEEVRVLRALEALERSGAPEAMDALRVLAKDAPDALVKQEAAAALDRLSRRIAAP